MKYAWHETGDGKVKIISGLSTGYACMPVSSN